MSLKTHIVHILLASAITAPAMAISPLSSNSGANLFPPLFGSPQNSCAVTLPRMQATALTPLPTLAFSTILSGVTARNFTSSLYPSSLFPLGLPAYPNPAFSSRASQIIGNNFSFFNAFTPTNPLFTPPQQVDQRDTLIPSLKDENTKLKMQLSKAEDGLWNSKKGEAYLWNETKSRGNNPTAFHNLRTIQTPLTPLYPASAQHDEKSELLSSLQAESAKLKTQLRKAEDGLWNSKKGGAYLWNEVKALQNDPMSFRNLRKN